MGKLVAEVDARKDSLAEHALAVRSMFDRISPTYDLLNRLMSMGIDERWRSRALTMLARDLPEGALLDACTGTLDLARAIEERFPGRPLLAGDFARAMIVRGRDKVSRGTGLLVLDAMQLPIQSESLAGMTCAFGVRNLSAPERTLAEALRVLKPGGSFVVLEFFRPTRVWTRIFHALYARFALPTMGYLVSRDKEAYGYLARSMRGFYSREEFEALGRKAGFRLVQGEDLTFGVASMVRFVK